MESNRGLFNPAPLVKHYESSRPAFQPLFSLAPACSAGCAVMAVQVKEEKFAGLRQNCKLTDQKRKPSAGTVAGGFGVATPLV